MNFVRKNLQEGVPEKAFKPHTIIDIGCSNRKIHSRGHRKSKETITSRPKMAKISVKDTKSCTTISQPGINFSRMSLYSSPYKA